MKILVAAALVLAPSSVLAQSCGSPPARPVIVRPAALTGKSTADVGTIRHQTFMVVKDWQTSIKPYRDCLTGIVTANKQSIAHADPKKDKDKIAQWKAEMTRADHAFDASVDTEELMVADFHAIQAAYCMRKDADNSVCPK